MPKSDITFRYILLVHFFALVSMSLIRLLFVITNAAQLSYFENNLYDLFWILVLSFARGFWFDNIVATAISAIPLIIGIITYRIKTVTKPILSIFNIYYIVIYTIVWAANIADLPYFNYFFKHLDSSIIMWKNDPTAYKMLLEESSYYIYFLAFILFSVAFAFLTSKIKKRLLKQSNSYQKVISRKSYKRIIVTVTMTLALCCGITGFIIPNPIGRNLDRIGLGGIFPLLGINPTYNFIDSVISSITIWSSVDNIITATNAITYIQRELDIKDKEKKESPIIHEMNMGEEPIKANIVVILMESMSSDFLSVKENDKEITPFLNSLINKSYYFSNFFSPGNHTSQGIAATLYGQPAIFEQHMLNQSYQYSGLSKNLKQVGYETSFFLTHDPAFDNTGFSAAANSFTNVYSMNDYPTEKQANALGVADDYLFEFGLNKIDDQQNNSKNPFFATFLTVSNHPPYVIPEAFRSVSDNQQYQIVSYCDDALRQFFEKASKQDWFKNTIFVLLGDHGSITSTPIYETPVSLHHIPLIIYSPLFENMPQRIDKIGSQIDTYPTIMGLLKQPYSNNSMGIDLMKTERTSAPISGQGLIAAIDKEYLYYYNIKTKIENLYKYRNSDRANYVQQYRAKADSMRLNSAAMLQVSKYMLENNFTQY